jgi:hypothetical protein
VRHRLREQIALRVLAAVLLQQGVLPFRLHALRHHRQLQAVRQRDDRRHDGAVFRTLFQVLDEGAVDLDLLDREALQVSQR